MWNSGPRRVDAEPIVAAEFSTTGLLGLSFMSGHIPDMFQITDALELGLQGEDLSGYVDLLLRRVIGELPLHSGDDNPLLGLGYFGHHL